MAEMELATLICGEIAALSGKTSMDSAALHTPQPIAEHRYR